MTHTRLIDKHGLPVIQIEGEGCKFNLHISIGVSEYDDTQYSVKQPISGEVSVVEKKIIDKHYRKWVAKWIARG